MDGGGLFGVFVFVACVVSAVGYLAHSGTFFITGAQWYEACWEQSRASAGFTIPVAPDPQTDIVWASCEPTAWRGVAAAGVMFAPRAFDELDTVAIALDAACPSVWSDLPVGGVYFLAVNVVRDQGGPSLLDGFLPAVALVARTFEAEWPECDAERQRQGFPRLEVRSDGSLGLAGPCPVCEAREARARLGLPAPATLTPEQEQALAQALANARARAAAARAAEAGAPATPNPAPPPPPGFVLDAPGTPADAALPATAPPPVADGVPLPPGFSIRGQDAPQPAPTP